ncbi:MAG: hypothetical protein JWQ35_449 [Bacteriovoracaceae bacterium]|nr:hypothetical protein [Bacteriovoracaceae bacterium]
MFHRLISFFSLFGSLGTIVCCALPALFVSLGAGATFAGLIGLFPQLIWLSEHKIIIFIFSGIALTLGGILQWRARNDACPTDPKMAQACKSTRGVSLIIYFISFGLYLIGALFAFVLPRFLS